MLFSAASITLSRRTGVLDLALLDGVLRGLRLLDLDVEIDLDLEVETFLARVRRDFGGGEWLTDGERGFLLRGGERERDDASEGVRDRRDVPISRLLIPPPPLL